MRDLLKTPPPLSVIAAQPQCSSEGSSHLGVRQGAPMCHKIYGGRGATRKHMDYFMAAIVIL